MIPADAAALDWRKLDGLVPAIVQDALTSTVLMLGFMNREALEETKRTGLVTFFSRSRQRLWRKGETSGHLLRVCSIGTDCDRDSLLIRAVPEGPTCHLGRESCFDGGGEGIGWLHRLEAIVAARGRERNEGSYTAKLLEQGLKRIGQKVGEEGVEVAIAASSGDDEELTQEIADLVYHLTVLLEARDLAWDSVARVLESRRGPA